MSKQYLIPVKDTRDAANAVARIPHVMEKGDEAVVLFVSDVPDAELIGSEPPAHVIDPLATTGGTASAPRAGADQPKFISSEEIMELRGRELCEALQPEVAGLNARGYKARVDAVFSDTPGATIHDYASDLNVTGVLVTEDYRSDLDLQTGGLVNTL